jgi:hypothetical protein
MWKTSVAAMLLALAIPAAVRSLWAVSTAFWTTATYEEFSQGDFKGISLGRDGSMTLAPQLDEVFDTGQAMIWAVARDSRGSLYLGTGHSGKVYRLGADLKGTVVFDGEEPDVFALAVDKDNRLYVGTSPDGKIYRVDGSGKSSEFFDPKTKYIWAMAFASDGNLFVGTGDRGRVFKIKPDGTGDVFYDTNQTNVMSLGIRPTGDLIAGTEPNGLLYKISSAGKGFVIYDAAQAEIHQIELGPDGSVYAAVLGGAEPRPQRPATAPASPQPGAVTAATTITVRAADDPLQMPGQGNPDQPEQPSQGGANNAAAAGLAARLPGIAGRTPGAGSRSAIVRIYPDSTVETLWKSTSENAFDLTASGNRLLFSTDEKGRVYQLTNGRDLSLLTQTDQEQTTRLIPVGGSGGNYVLLTTANLGKVYKMGTAPAATGSFESDIRDAGNIADWGQIRWHATLPAGTTLELFTRTGNSAKPDATWSDWSKAYKSAEGQPIESPAARYAQWKAVFHSDKNQSPTLEDVTLAYLPKNRAPEITEIKATPRAEQPSPAVNVTPGRSITVSGQGTRAFSGVGSAARQTPQRGVDISWLASDPDQDDLVYALYFRGEGETEWKLLQDDLKQNYFQLNPDSLPDGKYRLKVVASDAGENSAATAKTADRISGPFLVDFTPPVVSAVSATRAAGGATAKFQAADASNALVRAEYALDAEPLQVIISDDGIIDSPKESFTIQIGKLDNQEHLLTLRVYDAAGNVGVAKTVIPAVVPAGSR